MKVIQDCTLILNFVKKNFIGIQKKQIDLQSQVINDDQNNFKKILHILEDGASDVQVGDIEQAKV